MDRPRLGFESFTDQPKVANGASDLMVEIFGDAGRHARSAVGVNVLPRRRGGGRRHFRDRSTFYQLLVSRQTRTALQRASGGEARHRECENGSWVGTDGEHLPRLQGERPPVNASVLPDLAMPPVSRTAGIGLPCRRSLCAFGGMFARTGARCGLRFAIVAPRRWFFERSRWIDIQYPHGTVIDQHRESLIAQAQSLALKIELEPGRLGPNAPSPSATIVTFSLHS